MTTASLSPDQMAEKAQEVGISKTQNSFLKTFLLGFLGGIFIAMGAMFSTVIGTGLSAALPYGIVRLLSGLVFCLGLILVVIAGAEIFTGNILLFMAWANRKITFLSMIRNWGIIYLANLCGSIIAALLVFLSGQYKFANGAVGQGMLSVAVGKLDHTLLSVLFLGILCNILVCLAIWMTYSAKSSTGKLLVILFPITAFVAAGFEHSVADMYYFPTALFIKLFDPVFASTLSLDLSILTWGRSLAVLLMASLGNLIGGVLFVGLIYWLIYLRPANKSVNPR